MLDNVKKVFEENVWYIATFNEEPNVVPVGFKTVGDDGKFYIAAVLLDTTIQNIQKNGKIAIAAASAAAESYQVKGTAEFVTEGPVYEAFVKLAEDTFKGALPCKCAIAVTPEKVIVASPNGDNRKELSW
ncbi:MAG: pyridoxamine 5'-phosphate oxidase family protein [Oscillospiraceae bacterium]|nr:pyridoxamine 5'-phosphate oxidase family protein [Oscillospiraceae bacterium]